MHTTSQATGVTAFQLVTLIIGVVALVASAGSLTWQIVSWRLTGSVVKVDLMAGAFAQGGVMVGPLANFTPEHFADYPRDDLLFVVRATNSGRTAISVNHWNVLLSSGFGYSLMAWGANPDTPYRLEPGTNVDFRVPMHDIARAIFASNTIGTNKTFCGTVTLGTGVERKGKMHSIPSWLDQLFPPQTQSSAS